MATDAEHEDETSREWNEAYSPPPWSAIEEGGKWLVVCDGYNDETPTVFAGTEAWPLSEADAHLGAAALDLRDALQEMVDTYRDDCDDDDQPSMVRKALRALAKSRGES